MSQAVRAVRAAPTLLKVGFAEVVAYRAELVIWILTATAPILMMLVWDRVVEGAPIGRFDRGRVASYFCAALVVRQFATAWIVWELNFWVRTGRMSPALLKPISPLVYPAAENLAALPFRVVILVPVLLCVRLWRPEVALGIGAGGLPLLVLSVALAWLLNYLVQVAIGSLAFFVDQSAGLYLIWYGIFALLSGYLFPLEMLPDWARAIVDYLPFRALLGVPVEYAAGLLSPSQALAGVGLQVFWVLAAFLAARAVWRAGLRRYEAHGA